MKKYLRAMTGNKNLRSFIYRLIFHESLRHTHMIRISFRFAHEPVMVSELNSGVTFELCPSTQVDSITMYRMHEYRFHTAEIKAQAMRAQPCPLFWMNNQSVSIFISKFLCKIQQTTELHCFWGGSRKQKKKGFVLYCFCVFMLA
jgi:hypothetical protein